MHKKAKGLFIKIQTKNEKVNTIPKEYRIEIVTYPLFKELTSGRFFSSATKK